MTYRYETADEAFDREEAATLRQRAIRVAQRQMADEADPMRRKTYLELLEQWEHYQPGDDDEEP